MPAQSHPKIEMINASPEKKTQTVKKVKALQDQLSNSRALWHAKENPHSFLTAAQKKALLGVVVDKKFTNEIRATAASPRGILPSFDPEVDWRTKNGGKITPVKDQGTCGSCVSFGTVGLLEAMTMIERNILLDLSEADLHFCSNHGETCNGWYPAHAIQSVLERGVTDETHFPYASAFSGGTPHCIVTPNRSQQVYKFITTNWIVFDAYRKDYLCNHGPMVGCLTVYDDFFSYGGGIYHHVAGLKSGVHCILIVGYSQAQNCWICKNSWGTNWGEAGFFRIAYGECDIDSLLQPFFGIQGIILP